MPFSPQTKSGMFVRCGRLCCLCLRQCGINIEAAHIVDESKGGSNDETNGIPLCFDCHQEIGSYNNDHPRGDKFHPDELRARRDRVYQLVESGVVYAQIVAAQLHKASAAPTKQQLDDSLSRPAPPAEAKRLVEMLASHEEVDAPDRKLKLLSPGNRAYVIDSLLAQAPERPSAVAALCQAATNNLLTADEQRALAEQLVRAVTLFGSTAAKVALFGNVNPTVFSGTDNELRLALFDDVNHIIRRDQFKEVNELVPAIEAHIGAVPRELYAEFVLTMLDQARSDANRGAPAARQILTNITDDMGVAALPQVDRKFLAWHGREDAVKSFVSRFRKFSDPKHRPMLDDLIALPERAFREKYDPNWD